MCASSFLVRPLNVYDEDTKQVTAGHLQSRRAPEA